MTTHIPGIASQATTPPPFPSFKYEAYIRVPGDPVTRQRFEFTDLSLKVREFLSYQISERTRDEAARMLWVQGRPGEGKSEGCLVACLNAGHAVAVLSPGLFAGDTEGKSIEVLHDVLDEFVRWSTLHKRPIVVILDDFDLSAANVGDNVGHTINSQLLINEFMALADNRHRYRTPFGNLGFIITVNDASGMRESLHRTGRAIWHDHVPTAEDKANIAWAILAPQTTADRELVAALVKRHRSQPVAFWKALYHSMQALHAKQLLEAGMPQRADIDRAFGRRLKLTPEIAWKAARELRTHRVRSWLKSRLWRG